MKEDVVFWFGLQASDVIAISAACIALISGGITLWQGWLMRRHNILSVTPHIDVTTHLISENPINLIISNHGIGPAILDEIVFLKPDGSKYKLTDYESYELMFKLMGVDINSVSLLVRQISFGTPIGAGKDLELFSLYDSDPIKHLQIIDVLEKIEIEVSYKCIYGKAYVAKTLVF